MNDIIYLVWERESFDEYGVIFVTHDEREAKYWSGEPFACSWHDKTNDDSNCWYEVRELNVEYNIDGEKINE